MLNRVHKGIEEQGDKMQGEIHLEDPVFVGTGHNVSVESIE